MRSRSIRAAIFVGVALVSATLGYCSNAQAQVPAAAQQHRALLVRTANATWGLGAPVAVFAAQVHQESAWKPEAVSGVGARGLAQFMPSTASWWCELNKLAPADCQPHNTAWALRALVGYDKYLYDRTPTRYSEYDRMWVALRGYNGGLGHWQRGSGFRCRSAHGSRLTRHAAKPAAQLSTAVKTSATPAHPC